MGIGCIQGGNKIRVVASFKISCKEKIEAMAFLKREIQKIWNRIFNLSMNRFERKVSVLGWWNGRRCLLMPDAPTASKEYFRVPANRIILCFMHFIFLDFPLVDCAPNMNNYEVMKAGCCRWFRKMSPENHFCLKLWVKDNLWLLEKLTAGHLLFLILLTSIWQKGKPDVTCHPDSLLTNWKLFGPNWLKRTPLPPDLEISHNSALDHLNCLIDQLPRPTSEPWYRQRRWSSLTASQLLAGIVYIYHQFHCVSDSLSTVVNIVVISALVTAWRWNFYQRCTTHGMWKEYMQP